MVSNEQWAANLARTEKDEKEFQKLWEEHNNGRYLCHNTDVRKQRVFKYDFEECDREGPINVFYDLKTLRKGDYHNALGYVEVYQSRDSGSVKSIDETIADYYIYWKPNRRTYWIVPIEKLRELIENTTAENYKTNTTGVGGSGFIADLDLLATEKFVY